MPLRCWHHYSWVYTDFPGGSVVKNLPAMHETQVPSLGWDDPLEEETAIHFSILDWRIQCSEDPGYSPWGPRRVRCDFAMAHTYAQTERHIKFGLEHFWSRQIREINMIFQCQKV